MDACTARLGGVVRLAPRERNSCALFFSPSTHNVPRALDGVIMPIASEDRWLGCVRAVYSGRDALEEVGELSVDGDRCQAENVHPASLARLLETLPVRKTRQESVWSDESVFRPAGAMGGSKSRKRPYRPSRARAPRGETKFPKSASESDRPKSKSKSKSKSKPKSKSNPNPNPDPDPNQNPKAKTKPKSNPKAKSKSKSNPKPKPTEGRAHRTKRLKTEHAEHAEHAEHGGSAEHAEHADSEEHSELDMELDPGPELHTGSETPRMVHGDLPPGAVSLPPDADALLWDD
jgi:hypothetical protein